MKGDEEDLPNLDTNESLIHLCLRSKYSALTTTTSDTIYEISSDAAYKYNTLRRIMLLQLQILDSKYDRLILKVNLKVNS